MIINNLNRIKIKNKNSETVEAILPTIISASRSTDIPAFYSDWFINRLKTGYLKWTNPFNRKSQYIAFNNTKLIIFWSKNPLPLIKHLDWLNENYPNYYFQYTMNDYHKSMEENVPELENRIETFMKLAGKVGKEKVIWRFDPLLLTNKLGVEDLLMKIENIGNKLLGFTEKLVFSFADINVYKKVERNLKQQGINYQEFDEPTMVKFAKKLNELNKNWGYKICSCAEKINLTEFNITKNKCIDNELIIRLFSEDENLMRFFRSVQNYGQNDLFEQNNRKNQIDNKLKDKGQREECGCIISKDIGQYNTCPHLCTYCYANTTKQIALKNYRLHSENPEAETIAGI